MQRGTVNTRRVTVGAGHLPDDQRRRQAVTIRTQQGTAQPTLADDRPYSARGEESTVMWELESGAGGHIIDVIPSFKSPSGAAAAQSRAHPGQDASDLWLGDARARMSKALRLSEFGSCRDPDDAWQWRRPWRVGAASAPRSFGTRSLARWGPTLVASHPTTVKQLSGRVLDQRWLHCRLRPDRIRQP